MVVFRKKGIGTIFGIAGVIALIAYFLSNKLIERQMEKHLSNAVGAKVEFDGVSFSLLKLQFKWKRLQVTNPEDTWRNKFETGLVVFDVELEPLAYGRVVIEQVRLDSLKFNTKRSTNGAIPQSKKKKVSREGPGYLDEVGDRLALKMNGIPALKFLDLDNLNLDSLIKIADLECPRKLDSLKGNLIGKVDAWKDRINNLPGPQTAQTMTNDLLKLDPRNFKVPSDATKALDDLKKLRVRVDSLKNSVTSIKSDFDKDLNNVKGIDEALAIWVRHDFDNLAALAQLPDLSPEALAQILLGPSVLSRSKEALRYMALARQYSEKLMPLKPEKEVMPPRFAGQNISFGWTRSWPKFWLKKAAVSGVLPSQTSLGAELSNLTTNQKQINQATLVSGNSLTQNGVSFKLTGTFDYRNNIPKENFTLSLGSYPIDGFEFPKTEILPSRLESGKVGLDASLEILGDEILIRAGSQMSSLVFSQIPVNPNASRIESRMLEIANNMATEIKMVELQSQLHIAPNVFDFHLSSNLGNILSNQLRNILGPEIDKLRAELQGKLEAMALEQRKKVEAIVAEKKAELELKITEAQQQVAEMEKKAEAKKTELENLVKGKIDAVKAEAEAKVKETTAKAQAEADALKAKAEEEKRKVEEEAKNKAKKEAGGKLKGMLGR